MTLKAIEIEWVNKSCSRWLNQKYCQYISFFCARKRLNISRIRLLISVFLFLFFFRFASLTTSIGRSIKNSVLKFWAVKFIWCVTKWLRCVHFFIPFIQMFFPASFHPVNVCLRVFNIHAILILWMYIVQ